MKKLILLFLFISPFSFAQNGYNYLFGRFGVVYPKSIQFSGGLDLNMNYYNSIEIGLNAFMSTDQRKYKNALLGVYYKPLLSRSKNSQVKFRIGVVGGTDNSSFLIAPSGGFEFIQTLSKKWDFVITNNNGYYINSNPDYDWRISIEAGLRLAL